jgi:hypothetical protein
MFSGLPYDGALLYWEFGGPVPIGWDGTPLDSIVLAIADVSAVNGLGRFATMLLYEASGTVFTAATTNWTRGLSLDGGWNPVDQITKNILTHFPPIP